MSVVCCYVEISATIYSLVERRPTECGISECAYEASTMRRPWATRGCRAMEYIYILKQLKQCISTDMIKIVAVGLVYFRILGI